MGSPDNTRGTPRKASFMKFRFRAKKNPEGTRAAALRRAPASREIDSIENLFFVLCLFVFAVLSTAASATDERSTKSTPGIEAEISEAVSLASARDVEAPSRMPELAHRLQ